MFTPFQATMIFILSLIALPVGYFYVARSEKAKNIVGIAFILIMGWLFIADKTYGTTTEAEKRELARVRMCIDGTAALADCNAARDPYDKSCDKWKYYDNEYAATFDSELLWDCDPLFSREEM